MSTIAAMAAKKKPGRNIREAERNTVAVKLRLPPETSERLDDLSEEWGVTRSGVVARLVDEHDERVG